MPVKFKNGLIVEEFARAGIGTLTPDKTLHVLSPDQCPALFESTTAGGGIALMDSTTTNDSQVGIGAFGDHLCFRSGGASAGNMRLLSNGNLLIGTTSELTGGGRLQVSGTVNVSTINNGTGDFVTWDGNVLTRRTAAQVKTDIGVVDYEWILKDDPSDAGASVISGDGVVFRGTNGITTTRGTGAGGKEIIIDGSGTPSGTVTSITAGDGLSGGTITTSGTIDVDNTVVRVDDLLSDSLIGSTTNRFFRTTTGGVIIERTPAQVLGDIGAQASLTNPVTGTGSSGQVSFFNGTTTQTGDNGLFWDNTNKRLGVGLAVPTSLLHLQGGSAQLRIENTTAGLVDITQIDLTGTVTGSGTGNERSILFGKAATPARQAKISYGQGSSNGQLPFLSFFTGDNVSSLNEHLRITSTGNVGIGNTTPSSKLEVTGNVAVGYTNAAPEDGMIVAGNVGIGTTTPDAKLDVSNTGYAAIFGDSTFTDHWIGIRNSSTVGVQIGINDSFNGGLGGMLLKAGSNKNFGIAVNNTGNFNTITESDTSFLIDVNGNVGIGTTSPSGKLEVNTGGSAAYFTRTAGDDGLINPVVAIAADSSKGVIGASGDSLMFRVRSVGTSNPLGGTKVMTLLPTGNVGIGNDTPSSKLEVSGNVAIGYTNAAPTNGMIVAGDVGIGTASPGAKLQVAGNISFGERLSSTKYIGHQVGTTAGGNTNWIGFNRDGVDEFLTFGTHKQGVGSGERMRITSAGNVGIGTNSPTSLLTLRSAGNSTVRFEDSGTTSVSQITRQAGTGLEFIVSTSARDFFFKENANNLMVIEGTGNVGIGNTSPASKLEVTGNVAIGYTSAAPTNGMIVSGDVGIGTNSPGSPLDIQCNGSALGINIRQRTGNDFANLIFSNTTNTGLGSVGYVGTSRLRFTTNGLGDANEKLSILANGNVGIGTITPARALHIFTSSDTSAIRLGQNGVGSFDIGVRTGDILSIGSNNDLQHFNITSSGNVGIGTTTPSAKLEVVGTGKFIGVGFGSNGLHSTGANGGNGIYSIAGGSAGSGVYGFTNDLSSYGGTFENTTSGFALRVLGKSNFTGNVGIGTTSPSAKLDVDGDVSATSYKISGELVFDLAANNIYRVGDLGGIGNAELALYTEVGEAVRIDKDGFVGIGTTSPSFKLDVSGTARFTDTITAPTFSGDLTGNADTATYAQEAGFAVTAGGVDWADVNNKPDIPAIYTPDVHLITSGQDLNNDDWMQFDGTATQGSSGTSADFNLISFSSTGLYEVSYDIHTQSLFAERSTSGVYCNLGFGENVIGSTSIMYYRHSSFGHRNSHTAHFYVTVTNNMTDYLMFFWKITSGSGPNRTIDQVTPGSVTVRKIT
jgi:hypothetical protein